MPHEKLSPQPIFPIKQSMEASCVVASITMAISGFGVDITEQKLIEKYFPTAKLPATDQNAGVTNTNMLKGVAQIIRDLGLDNDLQIDIFEPDLYIHAQSPEDRYIVRVSPKVLRKQRDYFEKEKFEDMKDFFRALEEMAKANQIGVYTANSRILGLDKRQRYSFRSDLPEQAVRGFYEELTEFVRKGHVIGPHGGMTMHARVLDGASKIKLPDFSGRIPGRGSEEGFLIVDPRGESYYTAVEHLVWVDSMGVRGDTFDYLFRVSPKEVLNHHQYGRHSFLQDLQHFFRK